MIEESDKYKLISNNALTDDKIPWWKRPFDIVFSLIIIILTSPLLIFVAVIVKLTDKRAIFFKHKRVGYKGKTFEIFKFRTMYPDAEQRLKKILTENKDALDEWERTYKLKNDPRVTPIGKILRRYSLDELPQFFNVLKGDMSVVGPRPVVKEELEKYYKENSKYYLSVKPGITGLWQVEGRSDIKDYEERVKMDVEYVKNQSFLLDMKIILKTIWIMLTGKGAY